MFLLSTLRSTVNRQLHRMNIFYYTVYEYGRDNVIQNYLFVLLYTIVFYDPEGRFYNYYS